MQFSVEVLDEVSALLSEVLSGGGSLLSSFGSVSLVVGGGLGFSGSSFLVKGVQEVHLGLVS